MRPFWIALLVASSSAQNIVFVADGVHAWGELEPLLPKPKFRHLVAPYAWGETGPESASQASYIATGVSPTARNVISPKGTPIGAKKKAQGVSTGLVTDSCPLDPTGAAFFVKNVQRWDVRSIASQLNGTVDVVLGGGSRALVCDRPCCVSDRQSLARTQCPLGVPFQGTFSDIRAAMAGMCAPVSNITLEDMTTAALARLNAADVRSKFFLVVGGDRIDAAAHAGDTAALKDLYADFARAVTVATTLASQRADMAVIVTGDHETVLGTSSHSNATVPVLVFGNKVSAGAVSNHGDIFKLLSSR